MPRISRKKSSDGKALFHIPTQSADHVLENKKEWTTHEQKAFLLEELVEYKKLTTREYHRQWPALYQRWFQRWPERNHVPELKDLPTAEPLTDQQSIALAAAIDKRQKVCNSPVLYTSPHEPGYSNCGVGCAGTVEQAETGRLTARLTS